MDIGVTTERRKAYVEVLEVLRHMDNKYTEKIPATLIEFFGKNKSEEYNYELNSSLPFEKQEFMAKTLAVLAMLNLYYWCDDNNHRQELIEQYRIDGKLNDDAQLLEFNPQVFASDKNYNGIKEDNCVQDMVEYKESFMKKIIRKVKKILNLDR